MEDVGDRSEAQGQGPNVQEKENRPFDDESQQLQQQQLLQKSKMSRKSIGRRVSFAATAHVRFVFVLFSNRTLSF
jgi:hypothetical protein